MELSIATGLSLRGRVVERDLPSPPRTRVEARPQAFSGGRETSTRRDGSFELGRLMPGPHDLYLDGELVLRGVDPAVPQVDLTLERRQ